MSEDKIKGKIYFSRHFLNKQTNKTSLDSKSPSILFELWILDIYMLFDSLINLFAFKAFFSFVLISLDLQVH